MNPANRWKGALALALVALLVACFYWKLSFTDEYVWFDHPDMVYLELPRLEFQAREIQKGRFPLWDPHIWMGQPLVGQTQPGPVNPLNLLMMLWPLDEAGYLRIRVLNVYYVVLHMIAALGCFWLCRELKLSRTASVIAACLFSCGGFVGSAPWLDVLSGSLWTPYVTLFFIRAARWIRPVESAAWSGLFLGVAWLSGHHEVPLMVSLALGVAWAWVVWRQIGLRGRFAAAGLAALTFAIAGLVSAIQMLSTVEFGRLALRWGPAGGPVGWNDRVAYVSSAIYSLTPRGLAGIVFPDQGTAGDQSTFLGVVASSLAVMGVAACWRYRAVRWLATLAAGATIFALGEYTPVHGVVNTLVPALNKARVPVRALHLTDFAAALLVGYGVDALLRRRPVAMKWLHRAATCCAIVGGSVLLAMVAWQIVPSEALILSSFVSLVWFALTFAFARLKLGRAALCAALCLLAFAELYATLQRSWRSRLDERGQPYAKMLGENRDLMEFLRRERGETRVRVNDQDLPVNFGDLHSIDMQEGYTAGVTNNLLRFGRHMPVTQRLYSVTHYIGRKPDRPGIVDSYEGISGLKVFRTNDSLPRARSVHAAAAVGKESNLARRIDDPKFDPAKTVLLAGSRVPNLVDCGEGDDQVEITSYSPSRVQIHAWMRCRGMIILADTLYPGWEASLDGKPVEIWAAYGAIRGVVAEEGERKLEFVFRPKSVYWGAALTVAGVLATLLMTAVGRLRSGRGVRAASPGRDSRQ